MELAERRREFDDAIVRLTIINLERHGVTFRPGVFTAALEAALSQKSRDQVVDAVNAVLTDYRTDNLCICGHWHP